MDVLRMRLQALVKAKTKGCSWEKAMRVELIGETAADMLPPGGLWAGLLGPKAAAVAAEVDRVQRGAPASELVELVAAVGVASGGASQRTAD
eukprot:644552-Lingulodinium_polyedra.AAC.1